MDKNSKQNWILALVFAVPFIGYKLSLRLAEKWARDEK